MSKENPQLAVLTANRLSDGVVVFLDGTGAWVKGIGAAVVARTSEDARVLEAQGTRDAAGNLVVDPYLVEVREAADGPTPIRTRELVRVAGPSILADVPGYVSPVAVVRQAHHGESESGPQVHPRPPEARLRPEPVEGRAPGSSLVARQAHHEAIAAGDPRSPAEAA